MCLDDHRASPLMIRVQVQLCNEIRLRHARHSHEYRANNNNNGILLDFSFRKSFSIRRNFVEIAKANCNRRSLMSLRIQFIYTVEMEMEMVDG